jgi:hypothetical protein
VETTQPQRQRPMESWGNAGRSRPLARPRVTPGALESLGRLEIGRDTTPRHGLRICLAPAAPSTSANSRTRAAETVRQYASRSPPSAWPMRTRQPPALELWGLIGQSEPTLLLPAVTAPPPDRRPTSAKFQAPRSILTSIGLSCCDDSATHPATDARRTGEAISPNDRPAIGR